MKKAIFLLTALSAFAWAAPAFAGKSTFPFEVHKSGRGHTAILFIPGFGCSGAVWNETLPQFTPNFTCYTLTMAGFAGTPASSNASFRQWEQGIASFIQEEKLDKPIIVGHSMGGAMALALAADYPSLVGRIVVVDALPCLPALMNPGFTPAEHLDCGAVEQQILSASKEQFYQMQKMSVVSMLADSARREKVVEWTVNSDRQTFASMYCDFMNTDLRKALAHIQCPALILLEPGFAGLKTSIEEQYKELRTAKMAYATKGLHFIMFDDTEWYLGQLQQFIHQ